MPMNSDSVMSAAAVVFAQERQDELARRARQPMQVSVRRASGSGDLDHAFALDRAFRLVYVRCHFLGTLSRASFTLALDAAAGAEYDAELYMILRAGPGRDVNFRLSAEESAEPSPWTFQAGDALRLRWINPAPGAITWGVEVGLALAG